MHRLLGIHLLSMLRSECFLLHFPRATGVLGSKASNAYTHTISENSDSFLIMIYRIKWCWEGEVCKLWSVLLL